MSEYKQKPDGWVLRKGQFWRKLQIQPEQYSFPECKTKTKKVTEKGDNWNKNTMVRYEYPKKIPRKKARRGQWIGKNRRFFRDTLKSACKHTVCMNISGSIIQIWQMHSPEPCENDINSRAMKWDVDRHRFVLPHRRCLVRFFRPFPLTFNYGRE